MIMNKFGAEDFGSHDMRTNNTPQRFKMGEGVVFFDSVYDLTTSTPYESGEASGGGNRRCCVLLCSRGGVVQCWWRGGVVQ